MIDTVIADISKAFPSTIQKALDAIRSVSSEHSVELGGLTVVALREHASFQSKFPASWTFVDSAQGAPSLIAQRLQLLAGSRRNVLLLSFNADVWRLSRNAWPGLFVKAQHIFDDRGTNLSLIPPPASRATPTDGPEPPWTFDHVCALDVALATFAQVVERYYGNPGFGSPLRQTGLRNWMNMTNPGKFYGNAASTRSSGMMATLVRIASARGIVEVSGDPGDPQIWPKGHAGIPQQLAPSQPERPDTGIANLTETAATGLQTVHTTLESRRRIRQPDRYSCDRMSMAIEKAKMGPFPVARPIVYHALQDCVKSGAKLTLSSLVEGAIALAKSRLERSQPWPSIRLVTQKQLLRAQAVLNGDGKALKDNWMSGNLVVHSLAPDWQLQAEGEIILALFQVEEVTGDDLLNVCRSVWGSSESVALEKLFAVLDHLKNLGRIQEDNRGIFRVKSEQTVERTSVQPILLIEPSVSRSTEDSDDSESDNLVQ